jgi:hypothetical protein
VSAAHERLCVFVGNWYAEGRSYAEGQDADDPYASAVRWTSDESYEWLSGGFFLVHRWDALAGTRVFKGIEIIGYDADHERYFTHLFDNADNCVVYQGEVKGDVWTFTEPSTRVNITVADGGDSMTFNWEWRSGDSDWLPLCDRTAERIA